MKREIRLTIIAFLFVSVCRSQQVAPSAVDVSDKKNPESAYVKDVPTKPKLVVGIVIDQFRTDYLSRFYAQFGDNGFKRLLREGFNNRNTHYNYIPTLTGPGHTSIYAGTTPAVHGVVANSWYSREAGKNIYCAEDTLVLAVGSDSDAGLISSRHLLSTNIADELKLSTNQKAKVVGVAVKDRGAVFPAGHMPDGAYWFDRKYGKFISSTYFMERLPLWVNTFNDRNLPLQYMDSTWSPLLSLQDYDGPDDSPYEKVMKGKESPTFPYNLAALREANGNFDLLTYTPFANTIVTALAKAAIEGEQLGSDEITDLLAISYSSTDILGHSFGPRAVEVQDMYLRLDKDIQSLLAFLDEKIGEGEYVVFVTADHAAAEVPQYLSDLKLPTGLIKQKEMADDASAYLKDVFGVAGLIESAINLQFYINHKLVKSNSLSLRDVQHSLAAWLRDLPGVASVFTARQLQEQQFEGGPGQMLQKGYYYKRSGDVFLVLDPAWLEDRKVGTTHGSSYNYDTHVPLIWYGWGIKPGESVKRQNITDVAPTLSFLLNIGLPSGATGEPIQELFIK